jgi:hypothetical protein
MKKIKQNVVNDFNNDEHVESFLLSNKNNKELEYTFKCNWDWNKPLNNMDDEHFRITHKEHGCGGEHYVKIDINFYIKLIYRLIFRYGLSVNKEFIKNLILDFEKYFYKTIKNYEDGKWKNCNHFHDIEIDMELIADFCYSNYGELID